MESKKAIEVLKNQEEVLQFDQFTNADAWKLGSLMVEKAMKEDLKIAISIRLNSGYVLFQHGLAGSILDNEFWMTRKSNSVMRKEMSSLRLWATMTEDGDTLEDMFMDGMEYALCGGGFPLIIKGTGVIGSIMVSGLEHVADHNMVVECVAEYLKKEVECFETVEF